MDFSKYKYNQLCEDIVDVISKKTQSNNRHFFRILVSYYFCKVASMMRVSVETKDRGTIPVNMYALNLMPSGSGKGFSTNIMEEHIINSFKNHFLNNTFLTLAESKLAQITLERCEKYGTEQEVEEVKVQKEFDNLGTLVFSFDSGTSAAIKQMRHKLLMAGAGSMSFEMDEVGSNLLGNMEVLNTFLELYDVGKIKGKLIKNTNENKRSEEIDGKTPTNMMLFGTPSKLLDGDKCESEFSAMLETGYARRMFFGFIKEPEHFKHVTPEELYAILTDTSLNDIMETASKIFLTLSNISNFNKLLTMDKEVALRILEYKIYCEKTANNMSENREVEKAEICHRYYKALKLAGAYAFVDRSDKFEMEHLESAILLAEDSGKNFQELNNREPNYVRLAKHIVNSDKELTHVDLMQELKFYKGPEQYKKELMNLASTYGYKNNMIIKTYTEDSIQFFKGESLDETNLNKIRISYSKDLAHNYIPRTGEFKNLYKIITSSGYHYTNHFFREKHRHSNNAIKGFNLIILDVDENDSLYLDAAKTLLSDYTYLIATTKSHTRMKNRFRVILPISHEVRLTKQEYSEYMENVFNWIPFNSDQATKDIARKWESFNGNYYYNNGKLVDGTLFIPRTKKSLSISKFACESLDSLEKWFVREIGEGNRNNMLLRYGYVLADNSYGLHDIRSKIISFNEKLEKPLLEEEINSTIMVSLAKKVASK